MSHKIKLILAEDEPALALIIKESLETRNFEVLHCKDGEEALAAFTKSKVEILILDVMMPQIDGFSLANQLKDQLNIPYLFLTAKGQSFDRVLGLKIGADDYITKPCDPEELVLRIKNILKRNQPVLEEIIWIGNYNFNRNQMRLSFDEKEFQLTEKEVELLNYFILHNHKLVTRKEILETIWGENDYFMGRSLDVFMSRMRKYFQYDETIKFESIRGVGFKIDLPLA